MTNARTAATAAAASWVVAVRQMNGMDMGVATQLGSFALGDARATNVGQSAIVDCV
jgi:hypothetical protein